MKAKIAVLLTCFNRKEKTHKCLSSLYQNELRDVQMDVYLVDDGCTDGTDEMVISEFPAVRLLKGDGNLFWNGGMHMAFEAALKEKYDFYMWVNDDVEFIVPPVERLLNSYEELSREKKETIVVGVMVDHTLEKQTYGGIKIIPSFIPLKMGQVKMGQEYIQCDTFHGNCVLIPKCVSDKVGTMDPFYMHAFGDADYGLSATRMGCRVMMCNYPIGICERHDEENKWLDPKLSFKERRADYHKKTANPPRDWKYFCKKFCGWNWWLRYWAPDIKIFIQSILRK